MNLRAAVVASGMGLATACGASTDEHSEQDRTLSPGETALAEESEAREDSAGLCERGCAWLDRCCVETNRCLPSDCRSDCVTALESGPIPICLELGEAIIDCLTATSCNQLDMGLAPVCAAQNQQFTQQGCGQSGEYEGTLILRPVGEDVPAASTPPTAD